MAPLPVKSNKAGTLKSETDQQSSSEVKESNNLWVGNISREVADSDLMELFAQFGALDSVTTYSARSYAFVYFKHVEDAKQAKDALQGTSLRGNQIKIEFARPEQLPDFLDSREDHLERRRQPSNILWVGYPPSVRIDEQMLHNAMILFGEIERIKSFPSRHYSFVEFRSVDEARRAKEGLQGRLFNDPRITIMFSSSGLAPGKEYSSFYPGVKGPRPEMFNEHPFTPMDVMFDQPGGPGNFSGPFPPSGIHRPNLPVRPFGPQGVFDTLLQGGEFNDLAPSHSTRDTASGILPSPASGIRPSMRSVSSGWDVLDPSQFPREAKRSRIDAAPSVDDDSFPARKMDDRDLGLDKSYGLGPRGAYPSLQGNNSLSPVGGRFKGHFDNDFIWRGIVAKGGTPVCHARCVPTSCHKLLSKNRAGYAG
uniref:RRM domain-containing protein n=1 Tax=Salix viminalis TaxID=40686 RepID=A0A6N2L338_SALVM